MYNNSRINHFKEYRLQRVYHEMPSKQLLITWIVINNKLLNYGAETDSMSNKTNKTLLICLVSSP